MFEMERKGKFWLVGAGDVWVLCPTRATARVTRQALNALEALGNDRGRAIVGAKSWQVDIDRMPRWGYQSNFRLCNVHSAGTWICQCTSLGDAQQVREGFALLDEDEESLR